MNFCFLSEFLCYRFYFHVQARQRCWVLRVQPPLPSEKKEIKIILNDNSHDRRPTATNDCKGKSLLRGLSGGGFLYSHVFRRSFSLRFHFNVIEFGLFMRIIFISLVFCRQITTFSARKFVRPSFRVLRA